MTSDKAPVPRFQEAQGRATWHRVWVWAGRWGPHGARAQAACGTGLSALMAAQAHLWGTGILHWPLELGVQKASEAW